MKWTKVGEIIMQVLNNLDICNSSVNDEVLQIEQPPAEMNIIAEECSSCEYANVYVETIIDGNKKARPYAVVCSSCLVLLECLDNY